MVYIKYSLLGFCLVLTFLTAVFLAGRLSPARTISSEIASAPLVSRDEVTWTPMTPEALAAVTPHAPAPIPTPSPSRKFVAFFFGKEPVPVDVEGIIGALNDAKAQGLISMNDAQTGERSIVFVDADTRIIRGDETLTFAMLNIADTIRVHGKRDDTLQLISATSIDIIHREPTPVFAPEF